MTKNKNKQNNNKEKHPSAWAFNQSVILNYSIIRDFHKKWIDKKYFSQDRYSVLTTSVLRKLQTNIDRQLDRGISVSLQKGYIQKAATPSPKP